MKLKNRFGLVIFGIVIFLIATPILILYARGFQWDWKNHQFVKTGALVVKTQPDKATVFLNDIKQSSMTPSNIRFLASGDYTVRVEKDGYLSWMKRLTVKSQLVTWANADREFLTLFLAKPKLEQTWAVDSTSISNLADEIVYTKGDQAALISTTNGTSTDLGSINNLGLPLVYSTALVNWQNAKQIYSLLAAKTKWNITADQLSKIENLQTDGQHMVLTIDSQLYTIQGGNLNLLDNNVSTFTLSSDGVWYVQKNEIKHNDFTGNSEVVFNSVPTASKIQIIRTPNQIYLILDNVLYLVNGNLEKIYSPVKYAYMDNVSKQLVYSNDNEIYVYQTDTKNSDLILRSATPIKNPTLNIVTGYIFFQDLNKIKAIELDGRDQRNEYTIADALNNFAVSTDGKKLYTISGNQIDYYTIR